MLWEDIRCERVELVAWLRNVQINNFCVGWSGRGVTSKCRYMSLKCGNIVMDTFITLGCFSFCSMVTCVMEVYVCMCVCKDLGGCV